MTYYVIDTTLNPAQGQTFDSYPKIVTYLDGMSKRAYGKNRKDRMIMLEELGHGADDRDAVTFVRTMASAFEMGIVRNQGGQLQRIKCDITTIPLYQKEEYGN